MEGSDQVQPARPSSYIVIPARLRSTRLARKMLLRDTGKSLLQHTYETACKARRTSGVCVATDHVDIKTEVLRFGGEVYMTDPAAASGTDRVAEIAREMTEIEIFVNVQGDEPEMDPLAIEQVIGLLEADGGADVATLATPIRDRHVLIDPNCVKVVCDDRQRALYFSRSPIPYARDWSDDLLQQDPPRFLLHMGIYAYRRSFLLEWTGWPTAVLESIEKLEQLRVLAAGRAMSVGLWQDAPAGIDTIEDYQAFVSRMTGR